MRLRIKRKRIVGLGALLVVLSGVFLYFLAITSDIYIPFLNPPPEPTAIPVPMYYPPSTGIEIILPELFINFTLCANGTIAERVPIKIANAAAFVMSPGGFDISAVLIKFEGAIFYKDLAGVEFGFDTVHNSTNPISTYAGQFYFPFAGDYSPTIVVNYYRGQHPNLVQYLYSDVKVRVASSLDLQNQKATRINIALTYALVIFAMVESVKIVWDITNGEREPKSLPDQDSRSTPPIIAVPTAQMTSPATNIQN